MFLDLKVPVILTNIISVTVSFQTFDSKIPNGDRVANSCRPDETWNGVGYENPAGGGKRNPFGVDFDKFGKTWNKQICDADSDGDGFTNGAELGDPTCQWTPGSTFAIGVPSGHPGICEPMWKEGCRRKNEWLKPYCSPDTHCISRPGNTCKDCFLLSLDSHPVEMSPTRNEYRTCQRFELESNRFLVGMRPLWRSEGAKDVIKEIRVFGCFAGAAGVDQNVALYEKLIECKVEPPKGCETVLFRWKSDWGNSGICLSGPYGYKLNHADGFKYAFVQTTIVPLTNAATSVNHGVELYEAQTRPNNVATLTVGPSHIVIPPRQSAVNVSGFCSEDCTQSIFTANLNIAAVDVKMNSLGRQVNIEKWKNNQLTGSILYEPSYRASRPTLMTLPVPVEVQRDEEIRISCTYNSANKLSKTYEYEEQCQAVLVYYPQQMGVLTKGRERCVSYNKIDTCDVLDRKQTNRCNFEAFYAAPTTVTLFRDILEFCYKLNTATADASDVIAYCGAECKGVLEEAYKNLECLRGDMKYAFMDYLMGRHYLTAGETEKLKFDLEVYNGMAACRGKVEGDTLNGVDPNMVKTTNGKNPSNSSSNVTVNTGLLMILILVLILV